ncbi:hypothetical protein [Mucilaginibacter sp. UYCu711]|uniref:hypothetical protein n=1 Tax=Mucilaginibacter sp. UYCu711 TaxID=3156339 RepID=UPI003D1C5785
MQKTITAPIAPKIKFLGLVKTFGGFDDLKKLSTGLGSGKVVGDNLSYDIKPAYLVSGHHLSLTTCMHGCLKQAKRVLWNYTANLCSEMTKTA